MIGLGIGILIGAAQSAGTPAPATFTISAEFTEVGDILDITTPNPADGSFVLALVAPGDTVTKNGLGGWTGDTVLFSVTQSVGADSSSVTFDTGATEGVTYDLFLYQRTSEGIDSNVITTTYTKDVTPSGDTTFRSFAFDGDLAAHGLIREVPGKSTSSFQAWVRLDGGVTTGAYSFFASATGTEQIWFDAANTRIGARSGNGLTVYRTLGSRTDWVHIYATFGPGGMSLQVNGGTAATNATAPSELPITGNITVGQDDGPDNTFPGAMADVLYMTATGIKTYSGGNWLSYDGPYDAGDFHLLGYNGDGTDASGNDLHFTESAAGNITYSAVDLPPGA